MSKTNSTPAFSLQSHLRRMPVLDRFLVIEGVDGSGKSTQLARLAAFFHARGLNHWQTREPTFGPLGTYIRQQLAGASVDEGQLAALLAVDRAEHLYRNGEAPQEGGLVSLCHRGWWCLCDRYLFSSYAYQGRALGDRYIWQLNQTFPLPAWIFFLHLPEEHMLTRLRQRGHPSQIYERVDTLLHVQRRYQCLFQQLPKVHFHRLDAAQPIESISQQIISALCSQWE